MLRRTAVAATIAAAVFTVGAEHFRPADGPGAAVAIGALRAIYSAQETFASSCAAGGYASSLQDLRTPPLGSTAGFISPDPLGRGNYDVMLEPAAGARPHSDSCNGVDPVSAYIAHAEPKEGVRLPSFAMDQSGTIYMRDDGQQIDGRFTGAHALR